MMPFSFPNEGASYYQKGKVEQLDQKKEVFKRPLGDRETPTLGKRISCDKAILRDKLAYKLYNQSVVDACLGVWRVFLHRGVGQTETAVQMLG